MYAEFVNAGGNMNKEYQRKPSNRFWKRAHNGNSVYQTYRSLCSSSYLRNDRGIWCPNASCVYHVLPLQMCHTNIDLEDACRLVLHAYLLVSIYRTQFSACL
eukprot:GHVU01032411.1.p2 GENE.GHVU01032411.1~~GHVU01032411.1.p2  ORF type:complete len:102 (-),score=0.63 GHVU01032411.1:648-953(-)